METMKNACQEQLQERKLSPLPQRVRVENVVSIHSGCLAHHSFVLTRSRRLAERDL